MSTWWIDEPLLLGGSNPTDAELEPLRLSDFSVLICLLDLQEQAPRYHMDHGGPVGWEWHNIAIRDFSAPTVAQLRQFVALIETSLPKKKVVVHCEGGTGRTGTMAAAYWISKGLSVLEAITKVRQQRPHAVETQEQKAVLGDFASGA